MPSGRSGNQYFSHPTLWKNSYTYYTWTSTHLGDGSYQIAVDHWMYVQVNYGLQGTWSFRCSIGGYDQIVSTTINIPSGGNGQANTVKLGTYGARYDATTAFDPSTIVATFANITFSNSNGPGTSNISEYIQLGQKTIPSFTVATATAANVVSTDTTAGINIASTLNSNDAGYFKIRVVCAPNSGGSSIVKESSFGVTSFNTNFTGLLPHENYTISFHTIGKDGYLREQAPSNPTFIVVRTKDVYPIIVSASIASVTQNEAVLRTNVTSKSTLTYAYYLNDVLINTLTRPSGIVDYTFTGLIANTTSYAKLRVTNTGGVVETSQIAITTASTPPSITNVARVATSSSIQVTVTATASNGIRGYAFSLNNGTTWTAEQVSNIYTFNSLLPNTNHTIMVRVYDNLSVVSTSQGYPTLTLSNPPIISSVSISGITTTRAVIKVVASAGAGIKGYKYSTDNGSTYTTLITSNNYTVSGLTANTAYNVKVIVVDLQDTEVTSGTTAFTTLTTSPLDIVAKFKPIKNYSTELTNIPVVDGQLIVTVDDGRIYLDYFNTVSSTTQRILIGSNHKLYETTGTSTAYVITTPDISDYVSGLTFYVSPHLNSTGALTIDVNGLGPISVYKVDATTQGSWTAGRTYMVVYNATSNRFVDITS